MILNQNTAVATQQVLLVPYETQHVGKYHSWMQDARVREATASEPLSLEEEYENQVVWRLAKDKLTFIVCEAIGSESENNEDQARAKDEFGGTRDGGMLASVQAGVCDTQVQMRGDVNLFLYPDQDDESCRGVVGEVDVMIAATEHRGRGLGIGAVRALLGYVVRNVDALMAEYQGGQNSKSQGVESGSAQSPPDDSKAELRGFMVKIGQNNHASRALFAKVGFKERGQVDYFGEVTMVMAWEDVVDKAAGKEYREMKYSR
ncbi:hypothetical protein CDD81_7960 [Ophiocordyceps australis]|uniref:N-acetyltransferase domain-containing protein n=1 Tax=Ophiocordyceps australis TaxID=1399860 RepID=A0A2C5Y2A4_9HYPO|nr:hypothetical protein CDD81_7960 [Ophiocordyceps australis]